MGAWAFGGVLGLVLLAWGAAHLGAVWSEVGERAVMATLSGLILLGIAGAHLAFAR